MTHLVGVTLLLTCGPLTATSHPAGRATDGAARIQSIVDDLKVVLAIPVKVTAVVVPRNALLVSVEFAGDRDHGFRISFEEQFLADLNDDELRAVIAHELGHVWIFTHHPYLQTERLANDIARRAVSRDSLQKVYAKVWERGGAKGDLAQFLGAP